MQERKNRNWQVVIAERRTVLRWCAQDEVNQQESEQYGVDGTKKGAKFGYL